MALISTARFLALTDSLGRQYDDLLAMGAATDAANAQTGAAGNVTRIQGYDDDADLQVALLADFRAVQGSLETPYLALSTFRSALSAVQRHLAANGATSLDAYCTAQNVQVSASCAALCAANGVTVSTKNILAPTQVTLATETITGASAGTFGAGSSIDPASYGPALCEVVVTTDIGGTDLTVDLTMTRFDGTSATASVTIPASSAAGVTVGLGSLASDRYRDCSAVAITGASGTTGAFAVRSVAPRVPAR